MNLKYVIIATMFLPLIWGIGTPMLSQQRELDSIYSLIKEAPENSEKRFNEVMALAAIYKGYTPPKKQKLNFEKDYLRFGSKALAWAEIHGSAKQLAQARKFQFDYLIYYRLRIDIDDVRFFSIGQEMINEDVFYSKKDEYFIYQTLVDHYAAKGFHKESLALLPKKYELGRLLKKPFSELSNEYGEIGIVNYRLKDYKTAREFFKKNLATKRTDSLILSKATTINNIALTFAKEGIRDSAVYYYKQAIKVIENASGTIERYDFKTTNYHKHIIDVIKANIAYLDVQDGVYNNAITAIKRELFTGKRELEHTTVIQAYYKLGEIHYYKKQYELAEKYLDSTKSLFNKGGIHDTDHIKILRVRAKIMLATNRQDIGEEIFKQAQKFEDSINLLKLSEQTKIATVLYDTQAKENELQKQKLELAKRNEEILKKERTQSVYIIIVGVLLISILLFLWSNKKIKAKKKELEIQKQLVDSSLKEKETLLKEVHHRVKNNLQVVSSLLIKQGAISDNEQVKRLMQDGQNRIKSMAMVHQLLYQTEDFRNINLKEYTELLVSSISGSHQFQGMNITTHIKMDNLSTHIDIAVPYGLILNELISNSFEHGFAHGGPGEITIAVTEISQYKYELKVSDTGQGIPDDIDAKMKKSLGINLIKGLAWQLRGDLTYANTLQGSEFIVRFQNNLKDIS